MSVDSFNSQSSRFLEWFQSVAGGSMSNSIKIVDLREKNAGRGIVAVNDIPADTILFEIPRASILNVQTSELPKQLPSIFESDGTPLDDAQGKPLLDSWSSLILVMIYELLQQEKSKWGPYLAVLPTAFETPMFWSDAELDQLQASSVRQKIGKDEAEAMFRSKIIPVIRQNPAVFVSQESASDQDLLNLAHRVGSTIMSYAFDLENEDEDVEEDEDEWVEDREGKSMMGMVPMADMLNADAEFNAHINHGEGSLTATSLRPIKAGEEILNYYGPHPNSELLRRYGYVTEKHSRHDVVEIPWTLVLEAITHRLGISSTDLDKIAQNNEEEDMEDVFVLERECGEPQADGTFPAQPARPEIPGDLHEQLKGFLKAIQKMDAGRIPDKRRREEVQLEILRDVLGKLEARYGSSVAQDEVLLSQGVVESERQRMAVVVRLGEKRLIREMLGLLQKEEERDEVNDEGSRNKRMRFSN